MPKEALPWCHFPVVEKTRWRACWGSYSAVASEVRRSMHFLLTWPLGERYMSLRGLVFASRMCAVWIDARLNHDASFEGESVSARYLQSIYRVAFVRGEWDISRKRVFGLDPLVPASIWTGTKGPATSPQNGLATREALVPARNDPLVPVWVKPGLKGYALSGPHVRPL
jgi:hypothetical protein